MEFPIRDPHDPESIADRQRVFEQMRQTEQGRALLAVHERLLAAIDTLGERWREEEDQETDDETHEIAALTQQAIRTLTAVSAPHGFNLGINQGAVAGAGIAAHLHQHVVPRWGGDSNFMPIIARTKPLPVLLGDTRQRLADAWPGA